MVAARPDALLEAPVAEPRPKPGARFVWLVGAIAFAVYAVTLTHGLSWDDSAELQAGLGQLGVVHATGYAPYVLFGHVFVLLVPFGSEATAANLWSAVLAAGAVALTARYVLALWGSRLGALTAALLLGLGAIFWYQATVASVYPLLTLAMALVLNAALAWWRAPSTRRSALLAGSIGLVALAHPSGLLVAAGAGALVFMRRESVRGRRDRWALAAALIPAATLLYIPLRDGYDGFPNRSGVHLWDMLLSGSGTTPGDTPFTASAHGIVSHSWALVLVVLVSLSPAALVLVPAGLRHLRGERSYLFCCLAPAVVGSLLVVTMGRGFAYWHLPLVMAGAIACGAGVRPVAQALSGSRACVPLACALAALVLTAPALGALYLTKSDREASDWSRATLEGLPHGARVLAPWIAYAPLRAEQALNGTRPDVHVAQRSGSVTPDDLRRFRGGYAVAMGDARAHAQPVAGVSAGPLSAANFKGLSRLEAGPFKIGFPGTSARIYRLRPRLR